MQLFYLPGINENFCSLSEEESWHCVKVLRLREGDTIDLTNGEGWWFNGKMEKIHPKECVIEITDRSFQPKELKNLHVAIAPTKNIDRFEWFLEKATEIGIDEITPLICEHSERESIKMQRLEKVLISAMKQSLKPWLPKLNEPVKFVEFVKLSVTGMKLMAYCETNPESALHKVYRPESEVTILIGPEGDFSKKEVEIAMKNGFNAVNLGASRLRTETAGIVAVHTVRLMGELVKR
jgi:16S rRNA (uracil1498-N3)-methyltransferase